MKPCGVSFSVLGVIVIIKGAKCGTLVLKPVRKHCWPSALNHWNQKGSSAWQYFNILHESCGPSALCVLFFSFFCLFVFNSFVCVCVFAYMCLCVYVCVKGSELLYVRIIVSHRGGSEDLPSCYLLIHFLKEPGTFPCRSAESLAVALNYTVSHLHWINGCQTTCLQIISSGRRFKSDIPWLHPILLGWRKNTEKSTHSHLIKTAFFFLINAKWKHGKDYASRLEAKLLDFSS